MDGILLADKPAGISSFGVVAKVRGIIRAETGQKIKIGHTGTLDPAATGLMILVLGKYTKRAGDFSKLDKVYEVEARLGSTSTTADIEGTITKVSSKMPDLEEVRAVLANFQGEIAQIPPAFSAIKVNGQRAYKLARAGKEVTLEPRQVTIHSITDVKYDYPRLNFTVHVSSGTYIRSLITDIGQELGTGAYMSALRRSAVGEFKLNEAGPLEKFDFERIQAAIAKQ